MFAEIIKSWTYRKDEDSLLLVLRGPHKIGDTFNHDQYKLEAHQVVRWLAEVFCTKTLEYVRDELNTLCTAKMSPKPKVIDVAILPDGPCKCLGTCVGGKE